MRLKITGTQIYEEQEEKVMQEYEEAKVEKRDKIYIEYANETIIFDQEKMLLERKGNHPMIVKLKEEKELKYQTPYGIITLKTIGKDFFLQEKPFRLVVRYSIIVNETSKYENILELMEV